MAQTSVLSVTSLLLSMALAAMAHAQVLDEKANEPVRVTMTLNADGSQTTYRFDTSQKKASAVTTGKDGKVREKISYDLDDHGRFVRGVVSTGDDKFRFKSVYRYDGAGRMQEETHLQKDDALINKIVYDYDQAGKQTGYSVYDAAGKLIGRTSAPGPSPTAKKGGASGQGR